MIVAGHHLDVGFFLHNRSGNPATAGSKRRIFWFLTARPQCLDRSGRPEPHRSRSQLAAWSSCLNSQLHPLPANRPSILNSHVDTTCLFRQFLPCLTRKILYTEEVISFPCSVTAPRVLAYILLIFEKIR